jgi:hypothetical protein
MHCARAGRPIVVQNLSRMVGRHPEYQTRLPRELFHIGGRICRRARCKTSVPCSTSMPMEM